MASKLVEIDDRNFAELVATSEVPVLVDFTAAWCAPCRTIAPHVEAMASKYGERIRVGKCDVDSNHELVARFDVRSMPTLLMFKGGKVTGQIVGAVPRPRVEALVDASLGA